MLKLAVHGDRGRLGLAIIEKLKGDSRLLLTPLEQAEVVIDVTSPLGTQAVLSLCKERSLPLVIGTTGHSESDLKKIKEASCEIPILLASNFALGIDCLDEFLRILFRRYRNGFIDIIEKHHLQKKDSPSGTALFLKQRILHYSPESIVSLHSIRHPHEVGEHHLIFSFEEEKIEYIHKALSRKTFARGAIEAALFIAKQPPKSYQMREVYEIH